MATTNFKQGDKVTIRNVGFGYINGINTVANPGRMEDPSSYVVYLINQKTSGTGYQDHHLDAGWKK